MNHQNPKRVPFFLTSPKIHLNSRSHYWNGWPLQSRWIFGKVPNRDGGHFQFKNLCCRFWTFKQGFLRTELKNPVWNFSETVLNFELFLGCLCISLPTSNIFANILFLWVSLEYRLTKKEVQVARIGVTGRVCFRCFGQCPKENKTFLLMSSLIPRIQNLREWAGSYLGNS